MKDHGKRQHNAGDRITQAGALFHQPAGRAVQAHLAVGQHGAQHSADKAGDKRQRQAVGDCLPYAAVCKHKTVVFQRDAAKRKFSVGREKAGCHGGDQWKDIHQQQKGQAAPLHRRTPAPQRYTHRMILTNAFQPAAFFHHQALQCRAAQGNGRKHYRKCRSRLKSRGPEADHIFINISAQNRDPGRNAQKCRHRKIVDGRQESQHAAAGHRRGCLRQIYFGHRVGHAVARNAGCPFQIARNAAQQRKNIQIHHGRIANAHHQNDAAQRIKVHLAAQRALQKLIQAAAGRKHHAPRKGDDVRGDHIGRKR